MGVLFFILLCGIEIGGAAYALKQNDTLWKELDEDKPTDFFKQ